MLVLVALTICCARNGNGGAAEDVIVNCNQLEQWDRCDCNQRVLRALNKSKIATADPTQSPNTTPRHIQDAVQEEHRHRLMTFYAPNCEGTAREDNLPAFNQRTTRFSSPQARRTRFQPLLTTDLCILGCDVYAKDFLPGRWDGWQVLSDGKTTAMFLHIQDNVNGPFVKACSSHGLVFGAIRGTSRAGFLELPGPQMA